MRIYDKGMLSEYIDEMSRQIPSGLRRGRRREIIQSLERHQAVNEVGMALNLAANTFRGKSGAVWGDCPWDEFKMDNSKGMVFEDDFEQMGNATMSSAFAGSLGKWSVYGHAGATITDANLEGGVIQFQSDTADEGIAIYSSTGTFRLVTTSTLLANQKCWFEARVSRATVVTVTNEFFVGLVKPPLTSGLPTAAKPISATDDTLMTTSDLFGFHCDQTSGVRGGPTEVAVAFELTSGTVNYPTNLTTLMASTGQTVLAANTKVKLGFVFDPRGPLRRITSATARQTAGTIKAAMCRFFVNGLETPAFLTSDDCLNATATQAFPTAFMSPCFATMNGSGSFSTCEIDWVYCAQKANS